MTETETTTTNAFLQEEGLPRFSAIKAADLTPAVELLLPQMLQELNDLEAKLNSGSDGDESNDDMTVEYDHVLPEMEKIQSKLDYAWSIAQHLKSVLSSDELRTAFDENQPKIVESRQRFQQSKICYTALTRIQKALAAAGDDDDDFVISQQRRAVHNALHEMKLGGVGLEGAEKDRFNEIKTRLAKLSSTFTNNVLDETKAFGEIITDATVVQGVPESAKAMWANAYRMHVKQESGKEPEGEMNADEGPWRITLDGPSYMACMQHLKDRTLREKVYRAHSRKACEDTPDKNNVPIIYEILNLRTEMAGILGFSSYAELSLSSKMAPSIESVRELLDLVKDRALPAALKEMAEITALARELGGDEYSETNLPKLEPWDVRYWTERLKERTFELTDEETRPYFALPKVLEGMFALIQRLFHVSVQQVQGEAEVWNPNVMFFKVYDCLTQQHVASFFLDPYSRPDNKKGGAWMAECICKSKATNRDVAVAYLNCNGTQPVGNKPSLMTFDEVQTLFHETGHGLQHMLTRVTDGNVSGINGIDWDAVELPSQFMENWCYDKATVFGFARHWETGEPMPEEMFQKLKAQVTFNAGMMFCRQLHFGQLDMTLHSSEYDAKKGESGDGDSIFDVQKRIAEKYTPFSLPLADDRFLCSFNHIWAGGYAAGYYSYIWAEVMSADAYSAFEEVQNEEEIKKIGKKFRDTVLSLGGAKPPMEVFVSFRGREPKPDALLRHNGLA